MEHILHTRLGDFVCQNCPQRPKEWVAAKEFSHYLRHHLTLAEKRLWRELRYKNLGFRVRRQKVVGPYIADFYVSHAKLVIEVDGSYHDDQPDYDARRDEYMRSKGYGVLRFSNEVIFKDMPSVLSEIYRQVYNDLQVKNPA